MNKSKRWIIEVTDTVDNELVIGFVEGGYAGYITNDIKNALKLDKVRADTIRTCGLSIIGFNNLNHKLIELKI